MVRDYRFILYGPAMQNSVKKSNGMIVLLFISRSIEDPDMFCDLPGLKDLYLGDNQLKSIEFRFDCIKKLRFLDLQYNKIKRLDGHTMKQIDNAFANQKGRKINLIQNPWVCDCYLKPFIEWVLTTNSSLHQKQVIVF